MEQGSSDRVLLQLTTGYVYDIRNDQIRKFLDKYFELCGEKSLRYYEPIPRGYQL
jgi:hypothetical protein